MFLSRRAVACFLCVSFFATTSAVAYDAVDIAVEQLTTTNSKNQYVWGGNGPDGFDCSGLTKYAYGHVGKDLPRGTSTLAGEGVFVVSDVSTPENLRKLQRGDLLFFDTKKVMTNEITHVAMYEGDGAFIHASWTDVDIIRSNFKDPENGTWWESHFLFANRLPAPPGPSTSYVNGNVVEITEADVNVRGDPLGRDTVPVGDDENPDYVTSVEKRSPPAEGSIRSRPIYSGVPYNTPASWRWYVDFDSGADGWVAEQFLAKVGAVSPTVTITYIGSVTDVLNPNSVTLPSSIYVGAPVTGTFPYKPGLATLGQTSPDQPGWFPYFWEEENRIVGELRIGGQVFTQPQIEDFAVYTDFVFPDGDYYNGIQFFATTDTEYVTTWIFKIILGVPIPTDQRVVVREGLPTDTSDLQAGNANFVGGEYHSRDNNLEIRWNIDLNSVRVSSGELVNGVCGSAIDTCLSGRLKNNPPYDTIQYQQWQCMGENGGEDSVICRYDMGVPR